MKDLEQDLENDLQEYIDQFEEDFELDVNDKINTPLLNTIFREYIDQSSTPNKRYYYILNKRSKVEEKLLKTLNSRQKRLFEKYSFLEERIKDERVEQAFIYGFSLSTEFRYETKNILRKFRINKKATRK